MRGKILGIEARRVLTDMDEQIFYPVSSVLRRALFPTGFESVHGLRTSQDCKEFRSFYPFNEERVLKVDAIRSPWTTRSENMDAREVQRLIVTEEDRP